MPAPMLLTLRREERRGCRWCASLQINLHALKQVVGLILHLKHNVLIKCNFWYTVLKYLKYSWCLPPPHTGASHACMHSYTTCILLHIIYN